MNPNQIFIDSGRSLVLAVAGGGTRVFGDLLDHGGMSGVVLRGHVLQACESTDAYLGRRPDRYASDRTARQLAMRAYGEARTLRPGGNTVGVGATSSLRKPGGEREGRDHEVHVAVQKRDCTITLSASLRAGRDREREEGVAADLIGVGARWACGIWADARHYLDDADSWGFTVGIPQPVTIEGLVHGEEEVCYLEEVVGGPDPYVLPSACDPLHDGHVAMMEWAFEQTGRPTIVELCVANADKPPLDYLSISERVEGVRTRLKGLPFYAGLRLTSLPLFADKARAFPGTTFLVGSDTLERVGDPKFAGPDGSQLREIAANHCDFLVFLRGGTAFRPWDIHPDLGAISRLAVGFTPTDISSTAIRREALRVRA